MFLQQSQLALSASVDGLTGLWNRARIDQFFAVEGGNPPAILLREAIRFGVYLGKRAFDGGVVNARK